MQISFRVLLIMFISRLQRTTGESPNEDPAVFLARVAKLQPRIIGRIFRERSFFLGTCNKGNNGAVQKLMQVLGLNEVEQNMLYMALNGEVFSDDQHIAIIQSLVHPKKTRSKGILPKPPVRANRLGSVEIDWSQDREMFKKLVDLSRLGEVKKPKPGKLVRKITGIKLAILEQVLASGKVVAEDIYHQFEGECDSHLGIQRHIDGLNQDLKKNIVYIRDPIRSKSEFRIMRFYLSADAKQNDNHRQLVYGVKKEVHRRQIKKQEVLF